MQIILISLYMVRPVVQCSYSTNKYVKIPGRLTIFIIKEYELLGFHGMW